MLGRRFVLRPLVSLALASLSLRSFLFAFFPFYTQRTYSVLLVFIDTNGTL